MKKFSFSLQRLLNYKEQVFDSESAVLAEMNAVLRNLIKERDGLLKDRQKRAEDFEQLSANGTTPLEMTMHQNYLRRLREELAQKEQQIELQRRAAEKQAAKVFEIKVEISTMEKLKERKLEEYNYQDQKAQELFIEEFVSNAKATAEQ